MKLNTNIWKELGALAQYVELIDHDSGTVRFSADVTPEDRAAVEAVIAAHNPLAPDAWQNIAAIKAKAGQIILARLPDYKQRNYLARKAELQDILIAGGTLSTGEQAEWDFFAAEWAWAKAVRETSNAAELAGTPVDEIVWPT